ncbi:sensor histidine kinase [Clostridium ihumii]|uniref:sensor histidine kinase n=1 Tax=Clostridium ihumii TaxID=1470356 RepID=UPI00058F348D|nr:histidine kinase [Clostridium ihumii]
MRAMLGHDYDIYMRFLLIFYIAYDSVIKDYAIQQSIIFLLVIIITTISIHLIQDRFNKFMLVFQMIISFYFSIMYTPIAILFFYVSLVDLLLNFKLYTIANIAIIIVINFVIDDKTQTIQFIIISLAYLCCKKNYNMMIENNLKCRKEIEDKRIYIKSLNEKINKEIKYRNQALYTKDLEIRNELAGKVHDRVGHTIAGSIMQLEACKIVLNSDDKEKTCNMINNTIGVLRSGMNEIRKTLREIRPLDEQIGINKVKLLLEEKVQDTGFNFSLDYKGDMEKIDKEQWMFILDFIMETSTNTLKYSKGNHIGVKIEAFNKMCKTQVSDNGVGCKYIKKGIGLKSIEENALKLGGNILINSNEGFEVILLIPFKKY